MFGQKRSGVLAARSATGQVIVGNQLIKASSTSEDGNKKANEDGVVRESESVAPGPTAGESREAGGVKRLNIPAMFLQASGTTAQSSKPSNAGAPNPQRANGFSKPEQVGHGTESPRHVKPEQVGHGTESPRSTKPGQVGHGTESPRHVKPDQVGHGTESPRHVKPEQVGHGTESPRSTKPGQVGHGTESPRHVKPEQVGHGTESPRHVKPDQVGHGPESPRHVKPDQVGHGTESPRHVKPEQVGHGTESPRHVKPDQVGHGTESPRHVKPDQAGHGTESPRHATSNAALLRLTPGTTADHPKAAGHTKVTGTVTSPTAPVTSLPAPVTFPATPVTSLPARVTSPTAPVTSLPAPVAFPATSVTSPTARVTPLTAPVTPLTARTDHSRRAGDIEVTRPSASSTATEVTRPSASSTATEGPARISFPTSASCNDNSQGMQNQGPAINAITQDLQVKPCSNDVLAHGNKFKKISFDACDNKLPASPKAALPIHVDLSPIRQQYVRVVSHLKETEVSDCDEDDFADTPPPPPPRRSDQTHEPGTTPKPRITPIPAEVKVSPDEETVYHDGFTPVPDDGLYVEAVLEQKGEQESADMKPAQASKALDSKRQQREKAEARKKEEKERKEKEKKRLKEEKIKEKKEKAQLQKTAQAVSRHKAPSDEEEPESIYDDVLMSK